MVSIILFVAFAIELAFAAYCIHSRSYHPAIRSIMRVSAFAAFVMLIAMSAIEWSFRWYAFAALLLIWSLVGAMALVRKDGNCDVFRNGSVIRRAVLALLVVLLALSSALIFPEYEALETTGAYGVETVAYTYTDESRIETYSATGGPRKVTVQYWYPAGTDGKYPLIVFSHGSFGVKSSNLSLYRELASHGYVVCSIDHTYQCLFTTDIDGKTSLLHRGFMREVLAEDAESDKVQSYEYYRKWMGTRTGDMNFVIDFALEKAGGSDPDPVYALINTAKIGVMGHSLGGSAALGVGRIRDDVGAVIALEAPFMCDVVGVASGEFVWNEEPYPVPVLNIYSGSSWSRLNELPQYAVNAKLLQDTEAVAYNVYMRGAGHLSLTDLALTSPFLTRILNGQKASIDTEYCLATINQIALEFFDCYLKGKGGFAPRTVY
jgi:dienelactone hydrolase